MCLNCYAIARVIVLKTVLDHLATCFCFYMLMDYDDVAFIMLFENFQYFLKPFNYG